MRQRWVFGGECGHGGGRRRKLFRREITKSIGLFFGKTPKKVWHLWWWLWWLLLLFFQLPSEKPSTPRLSSSLISDVEIRLNRELKQHAIRRFQPVVVVGPSSWNYQGLHPRMDEAQGVVVGLTRILYVLWMDGDHHRRDRGGGWLSSSGLPQPADQTVVLLWRCRVLRLDSETSRLVNKILAGNSRGSSFRIDFYFL